MKSVVKILAATTIFVSTIRPAAQDEIKHEAGRQLEYKEEYEKKHTESMSSAIEDLNLFTADESQYLALVAEPALKELFDFSDNRLINLTGALKSWEYETIRNLNENLKKEILFKTLSKLGEDLVKKIIAIHSTNKELFSTVKAIFLDAYFSTLSSFYKENTKKPYINSENTNSLSDNIVKKISKKLDSLFKYDQSGQKLATFIVSLFNCITDPATCISAPSDGFIVRQAMLRRLSIMLDKATTDESERTHLYKLWAFDTLIADAYRYLKSLIGEGYYSLPFRTFTAFYYMAKFGSPEWICKKNLMQKARDLENNSMMLQSQIFLYQNAPKTKIDKAILDKLKAKLSGVWKKLDQQEKRALLSIFIAAQEGKGDGLDLIHTFMREIFLFSENFAALHIGYLVHKKKHLKIKQTVEDKNLEKTWSNLLESLSSMLNENILTIVKIGVRLPDPIDKASIEKIEEKIQVEKNQARNSEKNDKEEIAQKIKVLEEQLKQYTTKNLFAQLEKVFNTLMQKPERYTVYRYLKLINNAYFAQDKQSQRKIAKLIESQQPQEFILNMPSSSWSSWLKSVALRTKNYAVEKTIGTNKQQIINELNDAWYETMRYFYDTKTPLIDPHDL